MSKFKNVGNALSLDPMIAKKKNPENLSRYRDKSKRTSKSNLTRGAFGRQRYGEEPEYGGK